MTSICTMEEWRKVFFYFYMGGGCERGWLIDWFTLGSSPLVPMHPGLTDRPFVPHNLVSAQESPVPLPKFQMAPRLKILMSSGSKRGTQTYYPFLSKVPASESHPGSSMGPLWREMPVSRAFLSISSRLPSKGALPRGPPHRASSERNAPFLEPSERGWNSVLYLLRMG